MTGDSNKSICEFNGFRRPHYFHGMLLEDRDFLAEQGYHVAKRRMLNRTLHGSGIVCGLELKGEKDSKVITITSGLALDCWGNEIWVDQDFKVDIGKLIKTEKGKELPCPLDPKPEEKIYKYIGIRYREAGTDPVQVYLPGGGCDQSACEYSRTREGYCIEIVDCNMKNDDSGLLKMFCDCLQSGCKKTPKEGCLDCSGLEGAKACQCAVLQEFCEASVPCLECARCENDDYIVLGRIELDKKLEKVQSVCLNECRTYVLTGRMVQHLIMQTLGGVEKYVGIKGKNVVVPSASQLAANPIQALCWYLRYFVIEPGELEWKNCGPERPQEQRPVTYEQFKKFEETQTKETRGRVDEVMKKLGDIAKDFDDRIKKLEKLENPPK